MSTMNGNNDDNRRTSPRFKVKKDKKDDTENNSDGNSPTKKRKSDEYDDGKDAKGTEGADAVSGTSAKKKQKVEDDADDEKKKKYVAALKGDRKKATVEVNGVTKKVYELNNDEMEEALDKHDDPKDPFHLTQVALRVLSTSREFYKIHGGAEKRLAQDPLVYKDGTDVEGATQTERVVSNLRKYLTDPKNASGGSTAAEVSDLMKEKAADGQGVIDHTGVTEKQKLLGGSPLTKILDSVHTKVKGYKVNGEQFTAVTVRYSDEKGVKASKNQNRTDLLHAEAGISVRYNIATGTEEVKKMKRATTSLRAWLSTDIGMAQHPRNRKGGRWLENDTHDGDKHPWYNMQMTFFFKGQASKVGQYQQTVETPSKDEVAMLVDLAKKK